MFTNWLTSEVPIKSKDSSMSVPPDVVIELGPPPFTRFPAHSAILTSQSGFFRAAMSRASEQGKSPESSIYLPNITVDHFTPLLSYMYTGFLELNFENIFGVLLATHLLHMPRALEICRDFLAHTQRQQNDFYSSAVPTLNASVNSKVVRPIASKASNVGLNFVSAPIAPSSLLVPSQGTPFKTFAMSPNEMPVKIMKLNESESVEKQKDDEKEKHTKAQFKKSVSSKPTVLCAQAARKVSQIDQQSSNSGSESDKVIIDIASCDGPVRFRRIINEAYEKNKKQVLVPSSNEMNNNSEYHQSNVTSFHQQMVRNINEQYHKQKNSLSSHNSEESENSQHSGELYTCVYCNHTFKSKYCYQKHAKRHINPLNSLMKCRDRDDCESSDGDVIKMTNDNVSLKRDSIKPLDMNVQYYPCKTCGCKFPSYYFVHKHRKLCHPEIAADGSIQPIQSENIEDENSMNTKEATEDQ